MPMAGGRLPPPSQVTNRTLPISRFLPWRRHQGDDHLPDPVLGLPALQAPVPPQQLPCVDVGRDHELIRQRLAPGLRAAVQKWREDGLDPLSVRFPPAVGDPVDALVPELLSEEP